MMPSNADSISRLKLSPNHLIGLFLVCWTLLNIIQASTLEIHADEAYYWLYSRFLDWGYYDHPPMVAVFITIGYSILHNELGLRLLTIISSTLSLYILWLILKQYKVEAKWFILVIGGVFIFHIYGFTTTPDSPLFLFTILFYFIYRKYLTADNYKWALLLSFVIAGLLYSKYHGVLLIGFTVLSNPRLFKRKSFWLIATLSVVLYIPHILWQANHGFPSINYHLFERSGEQYNAEQTYLYIPGQLLMAGPLLGWLLFYAAFKNKVSDPFIKCLMFNLVGTVFFFFVNTLKGEVQPHWTLIAFVPLVILSLISLNQWSKPTKWISNLAVANIILILLLRVGLIIGAPLIRKIGQLRSYFGFRDWAYQVNKHAGNGYVVFDEGFQNPSKYDFYNNSVKGFAYDSRYYRRTQFDIWPIEDSMQHKSVYYVMKDSVQLKNVKIDTIVTGVGNWYGTWINDFRTYQQVTITPDVFKLKMAPGQVKIFDLVIENPYPFAIDFGKEGYLHDVIMGACLFKGNEVAYAQKAANSFYQIGLKPSQKIHYSFTFAAPALKGKYDMIFSLRTTPFPGSKNSRIIALTIE